MDLAGKRSSEHKQHLSGKLGRALAQGVRPLLSLGPSSLTGCGRGRCFTDGPSGTSLSGFADNQKILGRQVGQRVG